MRKMVLGKSLLLKIILLILSVTMITTTAMGWLNYKTSKNIIIDSLEVNAKHQVSIHASQFATWLQTRKSEVEVMANTDLVRFGEKEEILRYFNNEHERYGGLYSTISICDTEGNMTTNTGIDIFVANEPTFPEIMAGKSTISNPFVDKSDTSRLIVTFQVPVFDENRNVIRSVSGASPINQVFADATNFKIGQTDTVFVFQKDGLIIHHPDQTKVLNENLLESSNPEIRKLTEEMVKNEQGVSKVKLNGEDRMFFYATIPHTTWIMAVDVSLKEFTAQLTPLLIITIGSGIAALILNGVILFLLLRNMMKRIGRVAETAKKIAEGNLRIENIEDNRGDEITTLANSVNEIANNLREVLLQINKTINEVTGATSHFIQGVSATTASYQEITNSAQEVSEAAKLQLESIEQSTLAIDQMATGIQRVAESSYNVTEVATRTEQEAVEGSNRVTMVVQQMDSIYESVNKLSEVVQLLANRSREIGEISNIITGISNQTNLLALNAAIEAARAGEHGKGFAVVAEEVRKLAEQSRESADKISNLIDEVQANTEEAVMAMTTGAQDVQQGTEMAHEVGAMFSNILVAIKKVSEQIQEVSALSEQISASTEEVSASSNELLFSAQRSAANADKVTAQSDAQLLVIEDIRNSTETLSKMVTELENAMSKFTL